MTIKLRPYGDDKNDEAKKAPSNTPKRDNCSSPKSEQEQRDQLCSRPIGRGSEPGLWVGAGAYEY